MPLTTRAGAKRMRTEDDNAGLAEAAAGLTIDAIARSSQHIAMNPNTLVQGFDEDGGLGLTTEEEGSVSMDCELPELPAGTS